MRGRMRTAVVGGAVALALTASACGGGDSDGTTASSGPAKTGGVVTVYSGEPEHLIPTNTNESEGGQVLQALFVGLVDYDTKTTAPFNVVADKIESTDQKSWKITLKDGWTFHNGEPVTASSFVDAWNFGAYGPNAQGNSYFFDRIVGYADTQSKDPDGDGPAKAPAPKSKTMSGLKAVDDKTIEVQLAAPFSQFPLMLGYTAFFPLPKAAFNADGSIKPDFENAPIGNGPFKMDGTWQRNREIKVAKYDNYGGDKKPNVDGISFKIYGKMDAAFADLRAGTIDVVDAIPPEQLATAKREFGDRYGERETSSFNYLGIPLYDKRFENPKFRQALSMSIDREAINQAVFNGTRKAATGVVSPVVAGARPDACGELCTFAPDKAKALYAEAGPFNGVLDFWFNAGAGHDKYIEATAGSIKQTLGIDYKLRGDLQFAEYLKLADDKKFTGPFRLGWSMDYPSPENYLKPIYGSNGSSNNAGYKNPAFDALVQKGDEAPSVDQGIEFYHQAEDMVIKDMPVLPMYWGKMQFASSTKVANVSFDAFSYLDLFSISTV